MPQKHKMAFSAYAHAMSELLKGEVDNAKNELMKIKEAWKKFGIEIDVDASIEKMKKEVADKAGRGLIMTDLTKAPPRMGPHLRSFVSEGFADLQERRNKNKLHKLDKMKMAMDEAPPGKQPPAAVGKTEAPNTNFVFDKEKQVSSTSIPLKDYTDDELYNSSTRIDVAKVANSNKGIVIQYNNVTYGGYAPNLAIKFSTQLMMLNNADQRLKLLDACLSANGIKIQFIEDLTPIELVKKIASCINQQPDLNQAQKEEKFELVAKRITQMLLNETDVTNDYNLATGQKVTGRSYVNVGLGGGLLNSLFSNIALQDKSQDVGTISTDTLMKAGTADCRATNATFAAFLNIGYREMNSQKEAKILYTKMAHGVNPESFANCWPDDHNIVLVKERDGKVVVRDAYFDHVDGTPLRAAINGCVGSSTLAPNENEVGVKRNWAFQIPASPPYPPQQSIHHESKENTNSGPTPTKNKA